jgi:hypothetical protein
MFLLGTFLSYELERLCPVQLVRTICRVATTSLLFHGKLAAGLRVSEFEVESHKWDLIGPPSQHGLEDSQYLTAVLIMKRP